MKKLLFGILVALAFMSCKGDDGRDGRDGKDGFANFVSLDITIESANWKLAGSQIDGNAYYFADVYIDELTEQVYDKGALVAYMYDPQEDGNVKRLMPHTIYESGIDNNGNSFVWQTEYDLDYIWDGTMRLYAKSSDFYDGEKPPTSKFNIVLMW